MYVYMCVSYYVMKSANNNIITTVYKIYKNFSHLLK